MALRVDFHDIKRALDKGSVTPIQALHKWTTWALKQRTLELHPYFEYVRETLPIVTWHKPGEEMLINGYLPVTWTCPTDFYEWADRFMGQVFTMGAHLRSYIAERDPEHAERVLEKILSSIKAAAELARKQADPESPEYITQGKRTDLEHPSNTRKSNGSVDKPGILRRLARDRPDLLDRIEAGELTANAAAVEAGFRKPMKSIPIDSPDAAVRALSKAFPAAPDRLALARAAASCLPPAERAELAAALAAAPQEVAP